MEEEKESLTLQIKELDQAVQQKFEDNQNLQSQNKVLNDEL